MPPSFLLCRWSWFLGLWDAGLAYPFDPMRHGDGACIMHPMHTGLAGPHKILWRGVTHLANTSEASGPFFAKGMNTLVATWAHNDVPRSFSLQHPQVGNSDLEVKKVDSPACTEDGEETSGEASCPSGGAGSSSPGGDERKHQPLHAAALLAERETCVANSSTPLAFKCLTASATEEKCDHALPDSGRSYTGGMGYGYKAKKEGWSLLLFSFPLPSLKPFATVSCETTP